MTSAEIRKKFLEFFESKGHKVVPSSSLVPIGDSSVLLTTAGMQQFKPYYTGEKDPMKDFGSLRTVSIQKSFRTSDIDEVGDETHLTFFEMLGNFSFGDYFKENSLEWGWEFITKELEISPERCHVSVFEGDDEVPEDKDSIAIWKSLGLSDYKIKKACREDNFWGPTGSEGPCGPTSEIYVDGIEVWNHVFNEYYCNADKTLTPLQQKGVDTGMGLERLAKTVQSAQSVFETDLFVPLMDFLPEELPQKIKRIFTDHARGIVFLLSDGVLPSNKEAGYVLRRLLRRIFVYTHVHNLRPDTLEEMMKIIIGEYGGIYSELSGNRNSIINAMWEEYERFHKTLGHGMRELEKLENVDAASAFTLYESYGLPYEIIKELGGDKATGLNREDFEEEFKRHQEISRAGAVKKFGGHGINEHSEIRSATSEDDIKVITRLHTATHLLHQALHDVLGSGSEVKQMGSDITPERTRFDFTFPRKLTLDEVKKIEDIVNDNIKLNLPITAHKMPKETALKLKARAFFKEKYPDEVNVYSIGDPDLSKAYSKEFCDGPHVKSTGEIGVFKIIKEESSSAGIRRIRATVR